MSEKLSTFLPNIETKEQTTDSRYQVLQEAGIAVNTVICGDCLDILKTFPDDTIDLVVADPPYFLPVNSYVGVRADGYHRRSLADASVIRVFWERVMQELDRVTTSQAFYYVFCDGQSYPLFYIAMYPYCHKVRPLIWDKMVSYNGYTWRHQHELIAFGTKEESPEIPTGDGDIIKCRGVLQKDRNHPAEKPVDLLEKLLLKHKEHNPIVLDPFTGSGSLCIAAYRLGIDFIGIEFESDHVATAQRRLSEAKSQKSLQLEKI